MTGSLNFNHELQVRHKVMQNIKMGPQSAPTSPVSKTSGVHHKASTGSASNFFTFRWLFRGPKNSSKKKLKQINSKTKEKFATISTNTTKMFLRQSYSFDDIQQFFATQQTTGGQNNKKDMNLCKSSLDIESNTKSKCLTQFKCKLCLADKSSYEMHSIWSCGCPFCKTVSKAH